MAYTVTFGHNGKSAQYREYEIDTPDDLDTLPVQAEITAIGSLAHSRSNNTTYKLGNNREWYALSESGGSGLPESTPQDAGKVLTVGSTGAAEWAAAGGGNVCVVEIEGNSDQATYTLLSDYDDLKNAVDNRLPILVILSNEADPTVFMSASPYMVSSTGTGESFQIVLMLSFATANRIGVQLLHYILGIAIDGTVQAQESSYSLTSQPNS